MKPHIVVTGVALFIATAALAHDGVKNPAVMARMESMSSIANHMKTLGQMAKGARDFDASAARNAAAQISEHASETAALFEARETDPKSEALPVIWENFDDFSIKANATENVAKGLASSIEVKSDLPMAMKSLGQTCKACHEIYRK